ncbi:MAG: hypothetical protein M1812_003636 [Candelaria pacifica]|nr:MAG: hypothetical protein M1812_003636 [Candelaria pacifica]
MYTESIASGNSVASQILAVRQSGKPTINVSLNDDQQGNYGGYVRSYTTLDRLDGEVSVTAPQDTRFDDVQITFEGFAKTFVERLTPAATVNARTEAFQIFLKLNQPIDDATLPQPRVLEAGCTYRFPFTFVVPEQLLPRACLHNCESNQVHDAHLRLPPSLGDPNLASNGNCLLDDLAPAMSKISYAVKVLITRNRNSDGKQTTVGDKSRKIRVIPSTEEQPPMNIYEGDEQYILQREKDIKKGIFKGKLGRLTMSASQPKSLLLPPPQATGAACATTTMATVNLRFDPSERSSQPPKLGSLRSKMKVATYFSSRPMKDFPTKSSAITDYKRGLFVDSIPLSSRCIESAQWEKHDPSTSTGKTFYTAKVLVPITLPKNKSFTPTFHSCLVARIYQLDLTLSVQAPGVMTDPTIQLKLPLQISAARSLSATPIISASEQEAIAAREAEHYFEPRSIAPPSPEYVENIDTREEQAPLPLDQTSAAAPSAPPPGYSFFAGASHGVPVRIPSPLGVSPVCG